MRQFRTCICLAGEETSSVTPWAAAWHPWRPFPGSHPTLSRPELMMKPGPKAGTKQLSCIIWHTTSTCFTYRMYVLSAACVPSYYQYAGHNPVLQPAQTLLIARVRWSYCPPTTYDRISGPDRDMRPAYSRHWWFKPWQQSRGMSEAELQSCVQNSTSSAFFLVSQL